MMRSFTYALMPVLALAASCISRPQPSFEPVQYVSDIISRLPEDKEECDILDSCSFRRPGADGQIVLIDNQARCELLTSTFLTCDFFDNVTGETSDPSDRLPDFAGETVVQLVEDRVFPDVSEIARIASVEDALIALNMNPRAKVVVLSSQYLSAGRRDVDTLFSQFAVTVPVISSVEAMVHEAVDTYNNPYASIALMASPSVASSGFYQEAVQRIAPLATCVAASPDSTGSFRSFLDSCIAGGLKTIDAILVDDYAVSADSLQDECTSILATESVEDAPYRSLLAGGIHVIDPRRSVLSAVYLAMRRCNIFTHNIAYPAVCPAVYTLTDVNDFTARVQDMAPKTQQANVQDQYDSGGD